MRWRDFAHSLRPILFLQFVAPFFPSYLPRDSILLAAVETRSERLFREICSRHGYEIAAFAQKADLHQKTADFAVRAKDTRFIAEVKELTPNRDDLRQIREMKETGTTSGGGNISARARKAIKEASVQLRFHKNERVPLLIVLYDNVRTQDGRVAYPMYHVEPHVIDAAMFGDLVVIVPMKPGSPRPPDRSGGGRMMTETTKTYVSAVAVISDWDDKSLFIYHNRFATIPLPREIFSDDLSYHLEKHGAPFAEPWKWHPVSQ
jgi:hypothetical protein